LIFASLHSLFELAGRKNIINSYGKTG
jgi:hypothetical protein